MYSAIVMARERESFRLRRFTGMAKLKGYHQILLTSNLMVGLVGNADAAHKRIAQDHP